MSPSESGQRDPGPSRRALGALILIAAVVVVYLPAIHAGFVWDDDYNLTANPTLRSMSGLARIWTENTVPPWYPLYHTALWLQFQAWGDAALGYHWINVLLHAANALLVWALLARLGVGGAWVAAAVFALHPVQVESVAWITELKNVLSTTFYLAAGGAWLSWAGIGGPSSGRRRVVYVAAVGLFLAALLTKTVTATLPVALLLVVWWKRGKVGAPELRATLPLFGMALLLGLVTVIQERALGASGAAWSYGPLERVLVAGRALWFYAGKLVWPDPVVFVYPRWEIDVRDPLAWCWPLAAVAVVVALWAGRGRIGRGPLTGVLYFAVTLAPALGFFNVFYARYSQVADRWQYVACIGLIAVATATAARGLERLGPGGQVPGAILAVALLGLLGLTTRREAANYADAETLWRATLAENPQAFAAHNNLGGLLLERGEAAAAERHFREAVRVAPDFAEAHNNLGIVLHRGGRLEEAIAHYETALSLRDAYADALNNLGISLASAGRLEQATARFRQAVEAAPTLVSARRNLGVALLALSRPEAAADQFRELLRLAPDLVEAHVRLAASAEALDDPEGAVNAYRNALSLDPGSREAALGLAWLLATWPDAAVRDASEAVRLAESVASHGGERDVRAWDVLAAGLADAGRFAAALDAADRAVALARQARADSLAEEIEARRRLYEAGRPYRVREP